VECQNTLLNKKILLKPTNNRQSQELILIKLVANFQKSPPLPHTI